MLDGLDTDSCSDMAFASAGPSDQNDVFRILYELTAMELPDRGLIDVARREVKTREVLVGWGCVKDTSNPWKPLNCSLAQTTKNAIGNPPWYCRNLFSCRKI